jgi:hypothetical protein
MFQTEVWWISWLWRYTFFLYHSKFEIWPHILQMIWHRGMRQGRVERGEVHLTCQRLEGARLVILGDSKIFWHIEKWGISGFRYDVFRLESCGSEQSKEIIWCLLTSKCGLLWKFQVLLRDVLEEEADYGPGIVLVDYFFVCRGVPAHSLFGFKNNFNSWLMSVLAVMNILSKLLSTIGSPL